MAEVHAQAKQELLRQYQEVVTKYMNNIFETIDMDAHFKLKNQLGFNYFVDYLFLANVCYQASLDILNNEDHKYPETNDRLAEVIVKYPEYLTLAVFNADFQDESVTDHYEETLVHLASTLD
ncbi:hypothetical protein [Lactiplantibacillus fabifermentans]|uniref:Uncharacterized protein n=1 Tax=Lactiplantibacillus fabifermentans T30PCM01 TaxID=1400520 RepID=W6T4Y6_9LACO|nr:hypothetical protein [Lactiplantibacillus fabifermentans]ETY73007.1 hypothetical protein LFAB_14520 [Lactiplantibacillus fabifermentans T30PCM01]